MSVLRIRGLITAQIAIRIHHREYRMRLLGRKWLFRVAVDDHGRRIDQSLTGTRGLAITVGPPEIHEELTKNRTPRDRSPGVSPQRILFAQDRKLRRSSVIRTRACMFARESTCSGKKIR
jgi:hypothetical protein